MRRLSIFLITLLFCAGTALAQCTIDPNNQTVGISPPANTLDCVVNDGSTQFNETVQLLLPSSFQSFTLNSLTIDSLSNLPAGITYTCTNQSGQQSCTFGGGERGCILFSGTTTAPPGVYGIGIYATADVQLIGTVPVDSATAAGAGFSYELTVIMSGTSCPNTIQPLTLNIVVADDTICEGEQAGLNAFAGGGDGQYSYEWSNDSTTSLITPYPTSTTTYSVTVTDGQGSTISGTGTVVVLPAPDANFTFTVDTTNGMATFTSTSTNASDFTWDFGDGNVAAGANVTNTYAVFNSDTSYEVKLIALDNTNGCGSDSITKTVDFTAANDTSTGVIDLQASLMKANVYPNPNNGNFEVLVNLGNVNGKVNMRLINIEGREVYAETIHTQGGNMRLPVNVGLASEGIYFLYLQSDKGNAVSKVLIQK